VILEEIKAMLPHREPFLFLDGVERLEENHIEAFRDVRADESFFAGHFPGNPVLPGVLVVEAIAQAGILLALVRRGGRDGLDTLFTGIERVRFRRIVRPGERLLLTASILAERQGLYRIGGSARVGDELACEAVVLGMLR